MIKRRLLRGLKKVFLIVLCKFHVFIRDFNSQQIIGNEWREVGNDLEQKSTAGLKIGTLWLMVSTLNLPAQRSRSLR